MLLKVLVLLLVAQTQPQGGSGTVPGTYPPVSKKYWVPIRRPAQPAPAQKGGAKAESGKEEEGSSYEESPVDLLSPEDRISIMGGGRGAALPAYHVVQPGETLWDISERYFGDPWEWPRLWALNPHITNPHWLFPGTRVYLTARRPTDRERPSQMPPMGTKRVDHFIGLRLSDVDESVRNLAIVEGDASPAGTVESSVDGRILISAGDDIYVKGLAKEYATPGTTLGIYRILGPVKDPRTGALVGKIVRICGEGMVRSTGNGRVVVRVTDSIAPIRQGDFVGPVPHRFLDVRIRKGPDKKIRGAVAKGFLNKIMFSSGDIVVLSVGRDQGIEPGMVFTVAVKGTAGLDRDLLPMGERNESKGGQYPWQVEGRGVVLYSKGSVAVAIIRRSYLPIHIGDDALFGPWEGLR